jgi:hypothetical protein
MKAFTHHHVGEGNSGSPNLDTHFARARVSELDSEVPVRCYAIEENAFRALQTCWAVISVMLGVDGISSIINVSFSEVWTCVAGSIPS